MQLSTVEMIHDHTNIKIMCKIMKHLQNVLCYKKSHVCQLPINSFDR